VVFPRKRVQGERKEKQLHPEKGRGPSRIDNSQKKRRDQRITKEKGIREKLVDPAWAVKETLQEGPADS